MLEAAATTTDVASEPAETQALNEDSSLAEMAASSLSSLPLQVQAESTTLPSQNHTLPEAVQTDAVRSSATSAHDSTTDAAFLSTLPANAVAPTTSEALLSQPALTIGDAPLFASSAPTTDPTPLPSATSASQPSIQTPPHPTQSTTNSPVTIHTARLTSYTVAAQGKHTQVVEVKASENHLYGTQIAWFFNSSMDIGFSVTVNGEKIKPSSRCLTSRGLYTTKPNAKCTVVFEWDNSFSWITLKDINYEIIVRSPEEVQQIMNAELLQIDAKRREKQNDVPTAAEGTNDMKSQEGPQAERLQNEICMAETKSQQEDEKREEERMAEAERERIQADRDELTTAIHQFRDTFFSKQAEWNGNREKVELKMKSALEALTAQYRLEQQECEAFISQDQQSTNVQRQLLWAKSEPFEELRDILSNLGAN